MLHPFFDVIIPGEEYLGPPPKSPPLYLIVLLILVLGLSFYFICRTIKKSKINNAPEEPSASTEPDETE